LNCAKYRNFLESASHFGTRAGLERMKGDLLCEADESNMILQRK